MDIFNTHKKNLYVIGFVLLLVLSVYVIILSINSLRYGSNDSMQIQNVITVSGKGEVKVVPDVANVNFTIRKESKTVKEAQDGVSKVEVKVLEVLTENKIDQKDIKTLSVGFNPKYEYVYEGFNKPGKNIIVGYEAYESLEVKIRDIDSTGKLIQELSALQVNDLNGPNFSVDDEDFLKAEARKLAIEDAKKKAKDLSKGLGVKLGKVVSFNEGESYPVPMYDTVMTMSAKTESGGAILPQLSKGENTISSNVTITYQIH
ncbi:MAG: SIMPL domain-containing protein [Candidatus Pacebacteria bacterium]|nr:SIMPL domain-containing protein [Candidatus Paceibacterota bacterium]MCF7862470.1 SIMPL domain-containing protein [Candidatus Paceibacterota bacterium]